MGCTKSKEKQNNKKIKKQKSSESNSYKTRSNSHIDDKNTNNCLSTQKDRTYSQFQLKNDTNVAEQKVEQPVYQNQNEHLKELQIPSDQNNQLQEKELVIEYSNDNIQANQLSFEINKIKQQKQNQSSYSSQKQHEITHSQKLNNSAHSSQQQNQSAYYSQKQKSSTHSSQQQSENIHSSSQQLQNILQSSQQYKSKHSSQQQNSSIYSSLKQNENQFLSQQENKVLSKYSQFIDRGQIKIQNLSEKKDFPKLNPKSEKRYHELLELNTLIDSNLQQQDLTYDKDLVIVMGATGAGKSTTINYLLGKKLVSSQIQNQTNTQLFESISVDQGESEDAKISNNPNKTYTKTIDVYKLQHYENDRELLLVDTPGLLKHQESILDIANQVGITKLLQNARSVKFLLLIGHKDLVQTEGKVNLIEEAINQYSKLIKNYSMSQKSVLIGFTHSSNNTDLQQVSSELKTITQSFKDDFKGKEFLDLVVQNIDQGEKQFILVNPLENKERQTLIDYLFNLKEVPKSQIDYNFQYSVDQRTKKQIQKLIQKYKKDIINIFQREEYDQITTYLNLFSKLNQQLEMPFVKKVFLECVQGLINFDLVNSTISFLSRKLSLDVMPQMMEKIIKVSNYLCWTDKMKGQYKQINESIISYNDFMDILSSKLEQCYLQIEKTENYQAINQDLLKLFYIYFCNDIEETFKSNEKCLLEYYQDSIYIKNIYSVNYYNLSCNSICNRLAIMLQSMNYLRQQNELIDVNILENNLTNLQHLHEYKLGDHLQLNSKAIYLDQIEMWQDFINLKKEVFEIDFNDHNNIIQNIEIMKINYNFLAQIVGHKRLIDKHFPSYQSLLKNINSKLVKQTINLFNNAMQEKSLQVMEQSIKVGIEIMQINENIRVKLFDQYQSLVIYLSSIVEKKEMKFNSCISQIQGYLLPQLEKESEIEDLQNYYNFSQFMSFSKLSQYQFGNQSQAQQQSRLGSKIQVSSQYFSESQFQNQDESYDQSFPIQCEIKSENLPKLESSNKLQSKSKAQNRSKFENQQRLSNQTKIYNNPESHNLSQFQIRLVESKYNIQNSFRQENQKKPEKELNLENSLKISKQQQQQQEMLKSKTEDEFKVIQKKVISMQKILQKMNIKSYQTFQFFQNSEQNCRIDLNIFITKILETTQDQINEFKNHKGILNGLFILKQCSILLKDYTNSNQKYDEAAFQRIIQLICENIKIKVQQLNKKITSIQIPHTIDDSFKGIEEQILILSQIYKFLQSLEKYIVQNDNNERKTLQQLIQLIQTNKNNFSSNLIRKIKKNLYDYDVYRLPIDPQREQYILDQLLKLKGYPYCYSLLGSDVYETLLEKAIEEQNILINEINQYLNGNQELNETFNQESALLSLMQIRQASTLYHTHLYGRFENPANTLEIELMMKNKGLETRIKQMIRYLNYDQIFNFMKNCGEESETYKSIKKCLKVKIQLLFEQIIKSIHKRSFLSDENSNIIKRDLQSLEFSIVKLSEIKFKKFNIEQYFEQLGSQFNQFVVNQAKKFEKRLTSQKIQKANNSYIIVSRIVNNFSQYINEEYVDLPQSMKSQMKIHFHLLEDSININDKLKTAQQLKEIKMLALDQDSFKEDRQNVMNKVNQLIKESIVKYIEQRTTQKNVVSLDAICEDLRQEYQCLLAETLENFEEQYKEFFLPTIIQIRDQIQEIDVLFKEQKTRQIINLINSPTNKIVKQKITSKFTLFCDIFSDLFKNKYYMQQSSNLNFLSQIIVGIQQESYNSLNQKYQQLQALIEQEFIKLQISSIHGINQFLINQDFSGIEQLISFYQLNQLVLEFKFQSIKHEEFLSRVHQIFDKIQKQLKNSTAKFDHKKFNQIIKQIDLIEQTRVYLNEKQMSVVDILTLYLQDMKSAYNTFSYLKELNSTFNKGCWSLAKIQSDILDIRTTEICLGINTCLLLKNYTHIIQLIKQVEEFSQQTLESNLSLNNRNIIKTILNTYLDKLKSAQIRKDQENFDSYLFDQIEEISEIEKNFKGIIIQFLNWNGSEVIIKDIEKYVQNLVSQINDQNFEDKSDVHTFVVSIITIRRIGYEILQVHEFVLEQISQLIINKFQQFSSQFIQEISSELRKDTIGQLIIQENNRNFERIFNQQFEESYNHQSSQEYLNNIIGDYLSSNELSSQYEYYEDCQQKLLRQWQSGSLNAENILQCIKTLFLKFTSSYSSNYLNQKQITWTASQKQELVIMLAYLNTFWEIFNCQRRDISCVKLHPVYSIMRLISIDSSKTSTAIENHLIQVNSGEGKSIIIGITSCFFGLLGYQVDCCCSNKYLSQRNQKCFNQIFQKLEIEQMINYNTIENLLQSYLNETRKVGINLINDQSYMEQSRQNIFNLQTQQRILLLDEIDFLFNENFIYNTYPITLQYTNKDVINIFKYIWQNRSVQMEKFKQTEVYNNLFDNNPNLVQWQKIIDEQIKMMFQDVNGIEEYRYKMYIPSGQTKIKIQNQCLDESFSDREQSYKSAFAYIQEWEKKNLTQDVMNENLCFLINIGDFSFTQISQEYQYILGVSGTAKFMSQYQRNLTQTVLGIDKNTIFPSIYEQSNLLFEKKQNIIVKDTKLLQHLEISSQIEQIMNDNRTVIVIFQTNQEIDDFKKEINTNCVWQILSQETNYKDQIIMKATTMNMITFAVKSISSNCDFINIDQELNNCGGIHIIQTFISKDIAEEIYIKSRTSRNGQFGSYSLVLNKEDLIQQFNMNPNIRSFSQDIINQLRLTVQEKQEKQLEEKLNELSQIHNETMNLKQFLLNSNLQINEEIFDFLIQFNMLENRIIYEKNQYQFYNDLVGQIGIFDNQFEYDQHDNPKNVGLGIDNSFNDLSILIGLFYAEEGLDQDIQNLILPHLKKKGYKSYKIITTEQDFIAHLPQYEQAWVISGNKFHSEKMETQFQDAIQNHLKQQKGLMIWADNNPYVVHANLILQRISIGEYKNQPIYIKLEGSDQGNKVLKAGDFLETQQFCSHPITTGINHLHEGTTVCYPQVISNTPKDNFGQLNIIGLSSSSKPCFFVLSGANERGRIVFDCGFSKLMKNQQNNAGTITYVTNCYAWLYWKERFVQSI